MNEPISVQESLKKALPYNAYFKNLLILQINFHNGPIVSMGLLLIMRTSCLPIQAPCRKNLSHESSSEVFVKKS